MISKILKVAVIASVFAACSYAGTFKDMSLDEFFKIFPERNALVHEPKLKKGKTFDGYYAPIWTVYGTKKIQAVYENKVPLGIAEGEIRIICTGKCKSSKHTYKIIVKQDYPCFVVDDYYKAIGNTVTKIDEHTVELIREDWGTIMLSNFGRRGMTYVRAPVDSKRVHNILGKNLQCLKHDNAETWKIYTKQPDGSYKFFLEERFFYTSDHPVLKRLHIHPSSHKVSK